LSSRNRPARRGADRLGEVITIKLQRLKLSQIDTLSPGTSE
jgi:hypothetical protein